MKTFQVIDNTAINRPNKEELKAYTINLSKHFALLRNAIFTEDGIIGKLTSQLAVSANVNTLLLKKLEAVERTANNNAQYSRKETFEVHGIPLDVPDNSVEDTVLNIMNELKDEATPKYEASEIQACHRLSNKKKVICKMVARKRMREVITSRKKLKNKSLACVPNQVFISESMAPAFSTIDYYARNLKRKNMLHDCWFFNGSYTIVKVKGGDKLKIYHLSDLEEAMAMSEQDIIDMCPPKRRPKT